MFLRLRYYIFESNLKTKKIPFQVDAIGTIIV
jgi:hypothetical protein